MILENSIENFGYARIVLADYHQEYPLPDHTRARVFLAWDPNSISSLTPDQDYATVERFAAQLFPDLPDRYNGDYEHGMSLWIIQGNLGELCALQMEFAQMLMGGPRGGDDDTFDYWPNAFEMLVTLTEDLIALGASDYYIGLVGAVVKSAIALNGPAEEWEADAILTVVPNLTKLHNERTD